MNPNLSHVEFLEQIREKAAPASSFCGVYFLFDGSELVYVGQSVNVFSRMPDHAKKFTFTHVAYIEIPPAELLKIEAALIWKYRPRFNVRVTPPELTEAEITAVVLKAFGPTPIPGAADVPLPA